MVYKSRPEASDAQLAWDRFTVLHEAEPVEMEFLAGENAPGIWRFCYLDRGENATEVRLGAAGLEAVGSPDPDKLSRIKLRWERAARNREDMGRTPTWLGYMAFGVATLTMGVVIFTSDRVLRKWSGQPESSVASNVHWALAFLVMGWVLLALQHAAEWWRKYDPPRWMASGSADTVFWIMCLGMQWLLDALGSVSLR